jgi:hypothetical protein
MWKLSGFKEEIRRSSWLVRLKWEESVETVTPWQCTDEEAAVAVRDYIAAHPGAYATDIAEALRLPIMRTFKVCDALVESGEIEEGEVPMMDGYNDARGIYWTVVCWDCARELKGREPFPDGVCTAYEARCDGCGEVKTCTQPRDFGLSDEQVMAKGEKH